MKTLITRALGLLAFSYFMLSVAQAQTFPTKSIRLIVPYPPGGATDFLARAVFGKVGDILGQPVVIDNRPGAGTTIGADFVAHSAPDGYTLLIGDLGTFSLNPSLFTHLRTNPKKDFSLVSLTGRVQLVLVVNPSLPVKSVRELITFAKAHPGKVAYAAPGPGSPLHVAMDLFKQQAGIDLSPIPYKGTSDAMNDLISGEIQAMFLDLANAQQYVKSGRIRALAIGSAQPSSMLPGVPTVSDSGAPGFIAYAWNGVAAPAGTSTEIITTLNAAISKALQDPGVKQRLADSAVEPIPGSPAQFNDFMDSETLKWAKVIKTSKISIN